ncbi:MAG: hypothetical protein ACRDUY_08235 [Nitriliruptorales bacterium]
MSRRPKCPHHNCELTRSLGDGWLRRPHRTLSGRARGCLYTRRGR